MFHSLRSTLRRDWTLLVFELIIVVLGISISFALQDWRQGRHDIAEEQRFLDGFAVEIRQDREVLELHIKNIEDSLASIRSALDPTTRPGLDDAALDRVMDKVLGYNNFSPSVATYFELRQTGGSKLIRDKAQLGRIIALYERFYPQATEWDEINRNYILQTMFPFVDEHGPAFESHVEGAFAHGYHAVFEALEGNPQFRNKLRSNIMFKEGQRMVYDSLIRATDHLLVGLGRTE
ncbi:MAG: hypothetical protein P1V35_03475 [Planctomycetota bacterium]|nr:hypothetical protein [Planctomycetota bacterium]